MTARAHKQWVPATPIGKKEAAAALGVCQRTLEYRLKDEPPGYYFELRGRVKRFYRENIERLRRDKWDSQSSPIIEPESNKLGAPSPDDALEKALTQITSIGILRRQINIREIEEISPDEAQDYLIRELSK